MKNGKYTACRTSGTKAFALMLALVLVMGCAIGGTLAWLVATTDPVVNTFTVGDINITLNEHKLKDNNTLDTTADPVKENTGYKIVPGGSSPKDPKVTVLANSEKCYLFIHIEETNNEMDVNGVTENLVNYTLASGWSSVSGHGGFYYRVVDAATANTPFDVFKDNTVTYNENIVKGQVTTDNKPVIKITAAAIQFENIADVATAFSKLPSTFTGITASTT